jgi:hypothetical protein
MSYRTQGRISHQISSLRKQFDNAPGLPFSGWLVAEQVQRLLQEAGVDFRERLYTPSRTLWIFLSQVFSSDHSCREAVARFIAFLLASGKAPCAAETSSYCEARQKLPEAVFARLVQETGRQPHDEAPEKWLLQGRRIKVVDGTTVSMPDTPENQQAFPPSRTQRPGVGFPIARLVVVFSLAVGTAVDMAMGKYKGKQTGEISLFRVLKNSLLPGEIILGDRVYSSFFDIVMLQRRGVDVVVRKHQMRSSDFRRGERLGKNDHRIEWPRPVQRPEWMDAATYQTMPKALQLREVKVQIHQRGKRVRELVVVTTLLDADQFSVDDLAALYRARWHAELDLRSLKTTLQMDVLRCKTPEMVRKEVWTHLLAYNLVRTVIAQAAERHDLLPREISFKGALQTMNAFRDYLLMGRAVSPLWAETMLATIAQHRVGDRPDRVEPRAVKRRPKPHDLLTIPRHEARTRLLRTASA